VPKHAGFRPLVQSVTRALDLLEALAVPDDLGLVELALRVGLPPTTVHRLLSTLAARRYVVQDTVSGRYLLGYKVSELAEYLDRRTEQLRALARPHLESIKKVTGETVNLTVLEPPSIVYVDQVEGSRTVRMFARQGATVPAYATAAGKAMLAYIPPAVVAEIYGTEPLAPLTPQTLTSLDDLAAELIKVRRRGYAIDQEEQEPGVGCVAAPVFERSAAVVAALSVTAPISRIHSADPAELGELLVGRAWSISEALGCEHRPSASGITDSFHHSEAID
jgi:IclR family transcriptional regulator, acetate operon repressor